MLGCLPLSMLIHSFAFTCCSRLTFQLPTACRFSTTCGGTSPKASSPSSGTSMVPASACMAHKGSAYNAGRRLGAIHAMRRILDCCAPQSPLPTTPETSAIALGLDAPFSKPGWVAPWAGWPYPANTWWCTIAAWHPTVRTGVPGVQGVSCRGRSTEQKEDVGTRGTGG